MQEVDNGKSVGQSGVSNVYSVPLSEHLQKEKEENVKSNVAALF